MEISEKKGGPIVTTSLRRPVCLLSLDGGGIRGISSIVILKELMRHVNLGRAPEEHLQPWQVFDLIGGTSTGGIIAIMIGCLRMTLDECEIAYMTMAEKIFQPKRSKINPLRMVDFIQARERFDSQSMEKVLKEIIELRTGSEHTKLRSEESCESECKVFVTTVRADNQELCILRSYDNPFQPEGDAEEWNLWEALRATSAANTYFKEHRRDSLVYLDGALKANNPVYQVMMEADELWDDPAAVMVSIGTGEKTPAPIQGNIMKLARTLTKTLINPGDTDKHFRRDHKFMADNDLIYRFNVPRLGHVKLEDYRSIPAVIRDTRSHFNNTPMAETVKTCSDKIKYTLATEFCNPAFVKSRKASDLSPEEKDCLKLFHMAGGDYDSHLVNIESPVPGTCEWFMKHDTFTAWLEAKTASLLWVTANPGCGKTVMSSFLVDSLPGILPDYTICFFFFRADEEIRSESYRALCALLHQLLRKFPDATSAILDIVSSQEPALVTSNIEGLWDMLRIVLRAIDSPVVFIVDALDECLEASRNRFIDTLSAAFPQDSSIQMLPNSFKVLVTSRPWPIIEQRFKRLDIVRLRGEDHDRIAEDIERMVKYKVEELSNDNMLSDDSKVLVEQKLLSGADKTFLWVALVLENIYSLHSRTYKAIKKALENIPNDLNEFYQHTLNHFRDKDASYKLLRLVVTATNPLDLDEINILLNITPESSSLKDLQRDLEPNIEYTAKQLGGFFVRIIDSRVNLVHQTARDFLLLQQDQNGIPTPVNVDDGEADFAEGCIRLLTLDDIPERHLVDPSNDSLPADNPIYIEQFPQWSRTLYLRAARYWARDSGPEKLSKRDPSIQEKIHILCDIKGNVFFNWWCFYETMNQKQVLNQRVYFVLDRDYQNVAHTSTRHGDLIISKTFIELGHCKVTDLEEGGDLLKLAVARRHWNHVEWLLRDFNPAELQLDSALLSSVNWPHCSKQIMEALLEAGADVNAIQVDDNSLEKTPGGAAGHHPELLQILLDHGLIVTNSAILRSAHYNYPGGIRLLLLNDHREPEEKRGIVNKALKEAASFGYVSCFDAILEVASDLITDIPDPTEGLEYIIVTGDNESLVKLMERGYDFSQALNLASDLGYASSVELLLARHSWTKAQFDEALRRFFEAHTGSDLEGYVTKTMNRILSTKDGTKRLHTSLPIAPVFGTTITDRTAILKLYLNAGARIPAELFAKATSLVVAVNEDFALFLLQNRSLFQEGNLRMRGFLVIACFWGKRAIIEAILAEEGVNLNTPNSLGMTPLLAAVASGSSSIVSLLLENGARPGLQSVCSSQHESDDAGLSRAFASLTSTYIDLLGGELRESPLSLSRRLGYKDIEEMLEAAG